MFRSEITVFIPGSASPMLLAPYRDDIVIRRPQREPDTFRTCVDRDVGHLVVRAEVVYADLILKVLECYYLGPICCPSIFFRKPFPKAGAQLSFGLLHALHLVLRGEFIAENLAMRLSVGKHKWFNEHVLGNYWTSILI